MKKLNKFTLIALSAITFLSSCVKNDEEDFKIEKDVAVSKMTAEIIMGEDFLFGGSVQEYDLYINNPTGYQGFVNISVGEKHSFPIPGKKDEYKTQNITCQIKGSRAYIGKYYFAKIESFKIDGAEIPFKQKY